MEGDLSKNGSSTATPPVWLDRWHLSVSPGLDNFSPLWGLDGIIGFQQRFHAFDEVTGRNITERRHRITKSIPPTFPAYMNPPGSFVSETIAGKV
tara:strand:- start:59 stop:343 length:285 start_codon:yes stop_codon:yes gene_type:complete